MPRKHLFLPALAVLPALILAVTACAPTTPTRYVDRIFPAVTATKDITYATAPHLVSSAPVSLELDMFRPAGDTTTDRPAILWIHGGGFRTGNRATLQTVASEYAQRGYVSFTVEYRLDPTSKCLEVQDGTVTDPAEATRCRAAMDAAMHDTQAAVRWVRAHAGDYGVDPDRIVVAGASAGAVTALHVAARSDDPGDVGDLDGVDSRIQAALSLSGCNYQLDSIGPGDAPVHLVHARFDPLVPFTCAQQVVFRTRAVGGVAGSRFYPADATHAELLYLQFQAQIDAAWTAFLVDQLDLT